MNLIFLFRFYVAAFVGNRQFPGISHSNKKDGKRDAAEQAIRILIAEGQYRVPSQVSMVSSSFWKPLYFTSKPIQSAK